MSLLHAVQGYAVHGRPQWALHWGYPHQNHHHDPAVLRPLDFQSLVRGGKVLLNKEAVTVEESQ